MKLTHQTRADIAALMRTFQGEAVGQPTPIVIAAAADLVAHSMVTMFVQMRGRGEAVTAEMVDLSADDLCEQIKNAIVTNWRANVGETVQ